MGVHRKRIRLLYIQARIFFVIEDCASTFPFFFFSFFLPFFSIRVIFILYIYFSYMILYIIYYYYYHFFFHNIFAVRLYVVACCRLPAQTGPYACTCVSSTIWNKVIIILIVYFLEILQKITDEIKKITQKIKFWIQLFYTA